MTHPLTPREKVENALYSMEDWRQASPEYLIDNILTTIASGSGSGDLAELAEIATRCEEHWLSGPQEEAAIGVVVRRSQLEALLAENAAQRSDNAELREHRITADLLVSTLKADKAEAERKLAEAVGLLSELEQHVRAESEGRGHARAGVKSADAARTFLSKEAERG